jgi:tRNA nucleotidyltransferase (CCA-adding enzyme)
VELGASLRDDLARRDFTVNAIALHLADGELIWFPRAEEDLRAGRLRVLHDGSFRDDPTRLLRLARYGARLGFEPEGRTDELAVAAVADGALDTVTGPRLGAELRLLLGEPQPAALAALEPHGLGAAMLGPRFRVDPDLVARVLELCPRDARCDLASLAATLAGGRDKRALSDTLDRLSFPANERGIVAPVATGAELLRDAMQEPMTDAELWRRLRREPAEGVAVAGALGHGGPAEAAARRWLGDVRHRRLAITGDDFVAAGLSGPPVGAALDAATEAMLAGRAPTREAQVAAGLEAVGA